MIGSLRGVLAGRLSDSEVVVEVGGVGYRLSTTPKTQAALGRTGEPVFLYVHTHVREDAIVLFGFLHDAERRCFEALLGAHGVGPSLALSILSFLSPTSLATAVLEDDLGTLCAVPGVGRKTAARLLIDLKSRLDLPDLNSDMVTPATVGTISARAEAQAALTELGYGHDEARRALDGADESLGVEELLRRALRELAVR